ncbi:MAG: hypothetical protein ACE144_14330 [Thermodesulfobacteriota bacterium]
MKRVSFIFLVILFGSFCNPAMAWFDLTHIAIGKVAEFDQAYNLAAPDVAKLKADTVEEYNHWVNNPEANTLSPSLIRGQIQKYNLGKESEKTGHLYGAIVAAIRAYQDESAAGRFATYHLAYAGHYIGDLSMPFHNMERNAFNNSLRHIKNDGVIENEVLAHLDKIKLFPMTIKDEEDLIQNVALIATKSKELGYRLQKEDKDTMSAEEAYQQLSQSASLFKAVLEYVGYPKK